MDLTSNAFFLLICATFGIFYITPRNFQWMVLLAASVAYYASFGLTSFSLLMLSVLLTFLCAYLMPEQTVDGKTRRILLLVLGLAADFGVLLFLKYGAFFAQIASSLLRADLSLRTLLLPVGISYYTFQTSSYLIDVYRGQVRAESNPFRYMLFAFFFPQVAFGPIGRFDRLMPQLVEPCAFQAGRIKRGVMRITFGLFKKMLLAEWLFVFRAPVFEDPERFAGIAVFGVMLYGAELYADFSGGIDMMIGTAELFGVTLDENFRQPFFATGISDFWNRWHISLGSWMKDYVFYPLARTRVMTALGKALKGERKGARLWKTLPQSICSLVVFLLVGLWHGAGSGFVLFGLYHGVLIALSSVLSGVWKAARDALHIRTQSKGWRVFTVLRTYALVSFGWYFVCTESLTDIPRMIRASVSAFRPAQFLEIPAGRLGLSYTPYALVTVGLALLCVLLFGVLRERSVSIRGLLSRLPLPVQFALCLLLLLTIPLFSPMGTVRGFVYAQF